MSLRVPTKPRRKSWIRPALLAAAGVAACGMLVQGPWCRPRDAAAADAKRSPAPPVVVSWEEDGLVYEYHAPTGTECVFDLARDPRRLDNVISSHRDRAAAFRRALEAKLGVARLDELRAPYVESIRRLRADGYPLPLRSPSPPAPPNPDQRRGVSSTAMPQHAGVPEPAAAPRGE